MEEKKKFKIDGAIITGVALGIAMYLIMVGFADDLVDTASDPNIGFGGYLLEVAGIFVSFLLAFLVATVIHEGGHLIFGLMTGYKFSSFRILNVMLLKNNDGYHLKSYSLAGTAGQCILIAPEYDSKKSYPYVLYNAGGVLMNVVTALIVFLLVGKTEGFAYQFMFMLGILSVYFALTNGVPLTISGVNNDGKNIVELAKGKDNIYGFYLSMKINALLSEGYRIKDMPKKYFEIVTKNLNNTFVATRLAYAENYYFDLHDFKKSKELLNKMIFEKNGLIPLHKELSKIDLLTINFLEGDFDTSIINKTTEQLLKSMTDNISVIRYNYAKALLVEDDEAKANKLLEKFEKVAKKYPYQGEVATERDIIEIITQAKNKN